MLFCAFGIGVGILIHCYLAIFGISTLLLSNNIAGDLISMFGSFYLIFIGISSFKSESMTSKESKLIASSFINGFITNIFNIKAFVFFKGRSILYKDKGEILLLRFAQELEEFLKVDQLPKLEGKRMIMLMSAKKNNK